MPETTPASVIVVPPATEAAERVSPEAPAAEPAPEPPKPPSREAAKFAALKKADKEVVEKKQALAAERAALQAEREALAPVLEAIKTAKTNPKALIQAAGLNLDQILRAHLDDEVPEEVDKVTLLERRIEEREKKEAEEKAAKEKAELEAQDNHIKGMIAHYHAETTNFIKANPDDYELIIATDSFDDVFGVITEYFKQYGKLISPEVAAKQYEEHLYEEQKKLLSLKKFAPKQEEKQPEAAIEPVERVRPVPRSLTNTQVLGNPVAKRPRPLTEDERREAAMEKLRFKS